MKVFISFFITLFAGLSTLIGWLFVLYKPKNVDHFLHFCLCLSAGIMIGVSIIDLIPNGFYYIYSKFNQYIAIFSLVLTLFCGYVINCILSAIIRKNSLKNSSLFNLGIIGMVSMAIHNIPEGILTFLSSNIDISLGIKYAVAIMLHNIPEGIIISMPIYYATNDKRKAFYLTLFSGLSETLGGFISYFLFRNRVNLYIISIMLLIIAGLMISIVINDIFDEIKKYSKISYIGFILGILINIVLIYIH